MITWIVGLGNPGLDYEKTRHNAGFWFLDRLADNQAWSFKKPFNAQVVKIIRANRPLWLIKPQTFMNHSGQAVRAFGDYYGLDTSELLVVHDELDLPPGVARLKKGGGHGGHNGLKDIMAHLGTRDFARLRLGIGHPGHAKQVVNYVLKPPAKVEAQAIEQAIDISLPLVDELVLGQWNHAVQKLHTQT